LADFRITEACEADLPVIQELALQASAFTFNALRSTSSQRAEFLRREFDSLKRYWRQGRYRFLVARREETGPVLGYLLLNLYQTDDLGRRQTFVEDIGAHPESWGAGIGHALFDAATEVTAELGIDFMGGEVAASNPRWQAALRNRFELEAYRVVRACTPKGQALLDQVKRDSELQDRLRARQEARQRRRQS
jgi:ribosomal protein S18 acetylase RimI-like enzyme